MEKDIEKRIDEIVGEMAKIKGLNVDRLDKIEARLNEVPKEQMNDLIIKLLKNLQSSSI